MIRLERLVVRAGDFTLGPLALDLPTGGYGLVIGPTGSGKTTLLEAIAGHSPAADGRIWLDGREVTREPPERRGIGFVYQHYHLFPHRSVEQNIAYGLPRNGQGAEVRVRELAELLGIAPLLERRIQGLSGGEMQRVALARALAPRPRVLLLDEPLSAADPAARQRLRRELRALHDREGITTLQVTHNFEEALQLGDRVAVLADGRIAQDGPPEEVFRYPNSPFVARFIGAGTVLAGTVRRVEEAGTAGRHSGPFAGIFTSGPVRLQVIAEREGPTHAVLRPEHLVLSRDVPSGTARNHLSATVSAVETTGPVVHVQLDAGVPLHATITHTSAEALGLARGHDVVVTVKATAIHLF